MRGIIMAKVTYLNNINEELRFKRPYACSNAYYFFRSKAIFTLIAILVLTVNHETLANSISGIYSVENSCSASLIATERFDNFNPTGSNNQKNVSFAVVGRFEGRIVDKDTGEPLIGANVMLLNTTQGAATNINGVFSISELPEGEQTFEIRYVGYVTKRINIEIIPDDLVRMTIELVPEFIEGEEVIISTQVLGQIRAIRQQRGSDAIVNIVSEEKLRELPDNNAAEAIGRLPGVALQRSSGEGQKVIIRGMEPKFNNITINGVRVPSNDPFDKSVDLSMISSESLSGIEVYKSPTPDMDADAIGGTVNLTLKKAPNESISSIRGGGAHNFLKSDWANYNFSANLSRRYFNNNLGGIFQGTLEQINRSAQIFGGNYQILDEVRPRQFSLEDQIGTRQRASVSMNIDYQLPQGELTFYSYYASTDNSRVGRVQNFDPFDDNRVMYDHTHRESNMYLWSNMVGSKHDFNILSIDWMGSYSRTENKTPYDSFLQFSDDGAFAHNPAIRDGPRFHEWADSATVDYSRSHLYRGTLNNSRVNESNYSLSTNIRIPVSISARFFGEIKFGGKQQFQDRTYRNQSLAERHYYLRGAEMTNALKQWETQNDPMQLTSAGRVAMSNFFDADPFNVGTFLGGDYFMNNPVSTKMVDLWFDNQLSILNNDRFGLVDNYSLQERVSAAYFMLNMRLGSWAQIIPGLRYENSSGDYSAYYAALQDRYGLGGRLEDIDNKISYDDWLPHLHLKLMPFNWFDIRASYAQTLARPDYSMVMPNVLVNLNLARIRAGNPDLKHMTSSNYDLTLTIYNNRLGLLSMSAFYKDMTNVFYPVERMYIHNDSLAAVLGHPGRSGFELTSFDNSPSAEVYGFELELQSNLSALSTPFIRGIVFSMNVTRQYSETTKYSFVTRDSLVGRDPVTGRFIIERWSERHSREISMPGQAPLIVNLSIGYDYRGFSGRISGNYQDEYLVVPGASSVGDISNGSFWRWDIALRQRMSERLLLHANVANLNNMRERTYRNYDKRFPGRINHYGPILNIGFQLEF